MLTELLQSQVFVQGAKFIVKLATKEIKEKVMRKLEELEKEALQTANPYDDMYVKILKTFIELIDCPEDNKDSLYPMR